MSPFVLFLVFGGYLALYWGSHLAMHKGAAPLMYSAFKIGQATYPGLGNCG